MYCTDCGAENPDSASFCPQCGKAIAATSPRPKGIQQSAAVPTTPAAQPGQLASIGQRIAAWLIDAVLVAIPYLGIVALVSNLVMARRGNTIGLKLLGARIVRENGDLSGFFHTAVRNYYAALLSAIPLGLGFWWALWDPHKQTWHDKIMHTYVMRDTEELASRPGTSSRAAVIWFWVLIVSSIPAIILLLIVVYVFVLFLSDVYRD
jgi:uncharacterized RDD family membrane protein YckC